MTTASSYISTGKTIIPDLGQSRRYISFGGVTYDTSYEGVISYLNSVNGNTYLTPFLPGPRHNFVSPTNYGGLTLSSVSQKDYAILKSLPPSRRALQNFNTDRFLNYWVGDGITASGKGYNGYTGTWGTQSLSNQYPGPWPITGICQSYKLLADWLYGASANGVTVSALLMDNEATPYEPSIVDSTIYNALRNDARYTQTYFGLTSWADIYSSQGGSVSQPNTISNYNAWWAAKDAYMAKSMQVSFLQAMLEHNPNSIVSNYTYFKEGEPLLVEGRRNSVWPQDGSPHPHLEPGGNAAAPELYGGMRGTNGSRFIKRFDGKNLDIGATNYFRQFNKRMTLGPWASFVLTLAEARSAKRGSPETPLTPWVGSVDWTGPLYCLFSKEYELQMNYPWATAFQSPPDVLHSTTWKYRLTSVTKGYTGEFEGFTGWNGSTASFRVVTPKLDVVRGPVGGVWYKSNVIGVTYDGSTSAFKFTTVGTTGTTASVALFYSLPSLTAGLTYVFSYEIDLNRGYTGSLARFITWSTSDDSLTVPNRPSSTTNSTGFTFQQILPVLGSFANGATAIQYNVGDSGWTKVSWRFVGNSSINSTTTGIGMHVYYGFNSPTVTGGYDIYVRNPSFEIEGSTAISINRIDNVYQFVAAPAVYLSPTTNSSLQYFYNGITKGITYIFSYYKNLSRGSTLGPPNVQLIEHFKPWSIPNYPRGITFNRVLPSAAGPFFGTGPVDLSGYSGWTEISYEFVAPIRPFDDIDENNTLRISLIDMYNGYSIMNDGYNLAGLTAYYAHPRLQIKGVTSNTDLFFREATDEYDYALWCNASPSGFADLKLGYNSRQGVYISRDGYYLENMEGNSGYYYDYLRHLALLGTKYFGYFNPSQFVDMGFTGALQNWANYGFGANDWFVNIQSYQNGWTGWLNEQTEFNDCLKDVNERLGGFTTATADYGEYDWHSSYMANGAPSLGGNTWWWRVTVKPGYTMICNGVTLSARPNYPVGTWVATTGPTLAGIGMTWNAWELPQEPGVTAPTKEFNFLGMTYNNRVKEIGVSLTRSTTATYIGSSGYLMTASIDEPRLEYDADTLEPKGLLLEPAATNLLNWSETFSTSGGCNNNWIDLNLSRTSGNTSPSGNTGAIRFTATGGNATLIMTNGVTTGLVYGSWSSWLRGITGNESLYVTTNGGTSWKLIQGLSNKWKRLGSSLTDTELGMTYSSFHLGFRLGNTGDSVEIWGAQVEERLRNWSTPIPLESITYVDFTSYIPSGATRGSRSFDYARVAGSSFTSWYGVTQGTMLLEFMNIFDFSLSQSTGYNPQPCTYRSSQGSGIGIFNVNTSTTVNTITYWPFPQSGWPLNYPVKSIFSYTPNRLKISSNGNLGVGNISSSSTIVNYNQMNLSIVYGQWWDRVVSPGYIRKIMYWNYPFSDTDLKAMSLANVEPITRFNPYG
jgi:hypothetical protein